MRSGSAAIISLLLAALLATTVSAARDVSSRFGDATSCLSFKDSDTCLAGGCSWCSGSVLGDGCLSTDVAKLVPESVASCELPPEPSPDTVTSSAPDPGPTPGPGQGCMAAKTKKDCLKAKDFMGGGCAWCDSQWQGETCMGEQQAKYMPGAKCKFPKPSAAAVTLLDASKMPWGPSGGDFPYGPGGGKGKGGGIPYGPGGGKGGDSPSPGPGQGCMAATTKKQCMKAKGFMGGGCAWCDSQWQGESCMDETQAKFMPGAKCKFPKDRKHHGKKVSAEAAATVSKGPDPGPTPGPGQGCMGAKTKKDCLKAKDFMGGGCAWCESQWQGESCMGEQQAKVMPGAKCKFPKPSIQAA